VFHQYLEYGHQGHHSPLRASREIISRSGESCYTVSLLLNTVGIGGCVMGRRASPSENSLHFLNIEL
jgi:hypothetical protein